MKISIISTIYNKEKYLKKHLDSLLSQDYEDIEFIFVNDGSTDNSFDILKQTTKNNKKVIIIDQKNCGQRMSFKKTLKKCTGDYVYFVDSDDTLYQKNTISNCMKIFKEHPEIDFSINYMINSYQRKDVIDKIIYSKELETEKIYPINTLYNEIFRYSLCYKIIKRKIIKEDYFLNIKDLGDAYFTYAIFSNAKYFYYSKSPIYIVNRKNDNVSITRTLNINDFKSNYEVFDLCKKFNKFIISIEKQEAKTYLEQLNYSLKFKYDDRKKLIEFLKTKENLINKQYIITERSKKIYNKRYLYKNMFTNSIMHAYLKSKTFVIKILKK